MIKVKLVASTDASPLELASHAALKCYQSQDPKWGKLIDVENRLFKVGHHTTLQHSFFTFSIEGISVGDITFGLHLVNPFYNSDQRSGRYSSGIFIEPNFGDVRKYLKQFWPEMKVRQVDRVIDYMKKGTALYQSNISQATEIAKELLRKERPFASEKYIEMSAPKIAQEQLRMCVSMFFPTGLDFTVNLTVLAAMYRVAWTPVLQFIVSRMVGEVVGKFPEISFMFSKEGCSQALWSLAIPDIEKVEIKYGPTQKLIAISGEKEFIPPSFSEMHPVDLLHFSPRMMGNSLGEIMTQIELSAVTMGQDQRHRTFRRGIPVFTGSFYLPPILRKLKLEKEVREIMTDWIRVSQKVPETLGMVLAPHGAVVRYRKTGSMNALSHEQAKRLCFCAQEEIYQAGRILRLAIEKKRGRKSKLLQLFEPPCYRTGKCAEGGRYCGRDLKLRKTGDYFPKRAV